MKYGRQQVCTIGLMLCRIMSLWVCESVCLTMCGHIAACTLQRAELLIQSTLPLVHTNARARSRSVKVFAQVITSHLLWQCRPTPGCHHIDVTIGRPFHTHTRCQPVVRQRWLHQPLYITIEWFETPLALHEESRSICHHRPGSGPSRAIDKVSVRWWGNRKQ